jgi:hypothetical protein
MTPKTPLRGFAQVVRRSAQVEAQSGLSACFYCAQVVAQVVAQVCAGCSQVLVFIVRRLCAGLRRLTPLPTGGGFARLGGGLAPRDGRALA